MDQELTSHCRTSCKSSNRKQSFSAKMSQFELLDIASTNLHGSSDASCACQFAQNFCTTNRTRIGEHEAHSCLRVSSRRVCYVVTVQRRGNDVCGRPRFRGSCQRQPSAGTSWFFRNLDRQTCSRKGFTPCSGSHRSTQGAARPPCAWDARIITMQGEVEPKNRRLEETARTDHLSGIAIRQQVKEFATKRIFRG